MDDFVIRTYELTLMLPADDAEVDTAKMERAIYQNM
jgi:hypothetical protein